MPIQFPTGILGSVLVTSINGQKGDVTLTTDDVPEGSNEYYTDGKVSANPDVSANTAHSSGSVGDHSDVDLSGIATNDVLQFDGANLVPVDPSTIGGGGGAVDSVNGQTGVVTLDTDDIPEASNEYFTQAKVSANSDVIDSQNHSNGTVGDHSDIDLTGLQSGDLLQYDGANFVRVTKQQLQPTVTQVPLPFETTTGTILTLNSANTQSAMFHWFARRSNDSNDPLIRSGYLIASYNAYESQWSLSLDHRFDDNNDIGVDININIGTGEITYETTVEYDDDGNYSGQLSVQPMSEIPT